MSSTCASSDTHLVLDGPEQGPQGDMTEMARPRRSRSLREASWPWIAAQLGEAVVQGVKTVPELLSKEALLEALRIRSIDDIEMDDVSRQIFLVAGAVFLGCGILLQTVGGWFAVVAAIIALAAGAVSILAIVTGVTNEQSSSWEQSSRQIAKLLQRHFAERGGLPARFGALWIRAYRGIRCDGHVIGMGPKISILFDPQVMGGSRVSGPDADEFLAAWRRYIRERSELAGIEGFQVSFAPRFEVTDLPDYDPVGGEYEAPFDTASC